MTFTGALKRAVLRAEPKSGGGVLFGDAVGPPPRGAKMCVYLRLHTGSESIVTQVAGERSKDTSRGHCLSDTVYAAVAAG